MINGKRGRHRQRTQTELSVKKRSSSVKSTIFREQDSSKSWPNVSAASVDGSTIEEGVYVNVIKISGVKLIVEKID